MSLVCSWKLDWMQCQYLTDYNKNKQVSMLNSNLTNLFILFNEESRPYEFTCGESQRLIAGYFATNINQRKSIFSSSMVGRMGLVRAWFQTFSKYLCRPWRTKKMHIWSILSITFWRSLSVRVVFICWIGEWALFK